MRIKTRLLIYIGIWALSLAGLLGWLAHKQWHEYASNRRAVEDVERAGLALKVFEMVSRERGPTNAMLGSAKPAPIIQVQALATARANSEVAVARLRVSMQQLPEPERAEQLGALNRLNNNLTQARYRVDELIAQPVAERNGNDLDTAVAGMIAIATQASPIATRLAQPVERYGTDLNDAIVAARAAAELREQAGQLGSQFTRALVRHEALTAESSAAVERITGHIDVIRGGVINRTTRCCDSPGVTAAMANMDKQYFGAGLGLVDNLRHSWQRNEFPTLTTGEFAARYVPTMDSILQLRDSLLQAATQKALTNSVTARDNLIRLALLAVALFVLLIAPVILFGYRLLDTLTVSADIIKALAGGQLETTIPAPKRQDEIGDVMQAIAVLRDNSVARRNLESEREALIAELHQAATTDYLTGILNRRAFVALASLTLAQTRRRNGRCCVALLDIDHFKQVNDTWGHDVGDAVIRAVSDRCRVNLRNSDIFARYGGEEFILLLTDTDMAKALQTLERIRQDIAASGLTKIGDKTINLTISIGFSCLHEQAYTLEKMISQADLQLYKAKKQGRNQVAGSSAHEPFLPSSVRGPDDET